MAASRRCVCLLTTLSILPLSLHALHGDDTEQAKQLFVRAAEASSLEGQRYSAHFSFQVFGVKNGTIAGTLDLLTDGSGYSREELKAPGYHKVAIRAGDKTYTLRPGHYDPTRVTQLIELMQVIRSPEKWKPDWKAKKIFHEKRQNGEVTCASIEAPSQFKRTYCFDDQTRTLLERADQYSFGHSPPATAQYSDYKTFGAKLLPTRLSLHVDQQPAIEATLESIDLNASVSPEMFAAPANAEIGDWCANPTAPKATFRPDPSYPEGYSNIKSAHVVVVATISRDGSVRDAEVLDSARWPAFDTVALDAVRRWRFEPARCESKPIAAEAQIEINFSIP